MKRVIKFTVLILKRIGQFLKKSAKTIFKIFEVGILIKGLDGILEIIGSGILFYVVKPERMDKVILLLTAHELSQDPDDFIATHIFNFSQNVSVSSTLFGAVYLLLHGIIKIFLVIMLLKKKLWAYPVTIAALIMFASYQMYRYSHTHSPFLIFFSCFDLIMAVLTFLVYKQLKKQV